MQYIAENLFMNSQQILAQYDVKELFRKETSLWFWPFTLLAGTCMLAPLLLFANYGNTVRKLLPLQREAQGSAVKVSIHGSRYTGELIFTYQHAFKLKCREIGGEGNIEPVEAGEREKAVCLTLFLWTLPLCQERL